VYTQDMLQKTYGGRLTILSKVATQAANDTREKKEG